MRPGARRLERGRGPKHRRFGKPRSHNLKADWEPFAGEACRNAARRQMSKAETVAQRNPANGLGWVERVAWWIVHAGLPCGVW